jgi:hypothetical protein
MSSEDPVYQIKYIAIVNLLNKSTLINFFNHNYESDKQKLINSSENLIDKLLMISICNNERHTENLRNEKICSEVDSKAQWCFLVITQYDYPERLSYSIITDLKNKYLPSLNTNIIDNFSQTTKHLKDKIQLSMVELERNFRDPANVSAIHKVNKDIREVNQIMRTNIRNVVNNDDTLQELNKKAANINTVALDFANNSKDIKKYYKWQNKKLAVIGGSCVVGILGFLAFKFIL